MAVVPYSSDVLCTHKTRRQLLYTDVQQLKMVQMVSQPLIILRFLSMLSDALAFVFPYFTFLNTSTPLWPPKPSEPDAAQSTVQETPFWGR